MKIGELFRRESCSADDILNRQLENARRGFPNATSDLHALALACSALRKNLDERTAERDRYSLALHNAGVNTYAAK